VCGDEGPANAGPSCVRGYTGPIPRAFRHALRESRTREQN
jgi:hypothetical protein